MSTNPPRAAASPDAPHAAWTVLRSRPLLDRRPWLLVTEQDVVLPNRRRIDGYLLAEARDYATIFAVTADGRVPLVQQYKHGVQEVCLDVPAGYLDSPDEAPLACARRELAEEVGLVSDEWHHLASLAVDTNRGQTRFHAFLALNARAGGAAHLDETETLTSSLHPLADVRRWALRGDIITAASVTTILLALERLPSHPPSPAGG